MTFDQRDPTPRSQGATGRQSPGAQGATRGSRRPDDAESPSDRASGDDSGPRSGQARSGAKRGATFLGLPVMLVYAIGAAVIGLIFIGAVCSGPTAAGTVSGQVKALSAERAVSTLAGAQVVLRGPRETFTTVTKDVDPAAEGEAAYNYRFENLPPGTYTMAVTPPAGAALQPESDITLEVKSGELFPQSVMLLAQGIQKPRALAPSEVEPGQVGYINDRGERVVYQQGSGFDASDALLMYLLWRNPPIWGYGAPPIIVNNPGSSTTGSNYRVTNPPSRSTSGQTVTQQRPSVPGQGSTRPSSGTGATGSGPTYNSGSNTSTQPSEAVKPSTSSGGASSGSSSSGSSGSTTTTTRPSSPSQGVSRPSSSGSSTSRPSGSTSRPSSGGGRR